MDKVKWDSRKPGIGLLYREDNAYTATIFVPPAKLRSISIIIANHRFCMEARDFQCNFQHTHCKGVLLLPVFAWTH